MFSDDEVSERTCKYCGYMDCYDEECQKVEYIGLHKNRLDGPSGRVEKILVENWKKLNMKKVGLSNPVLECLMRVYCDKDDKDILPPWERRGGCPHGEKYPIGPPTERDWIVAETVIQWLGSNIGREFLSQCGFERKTLY